MFSAQSSISTLSKNRESSFHMEIIQLIETEVAQLLDLKYKDMSTIIMKKFNVLMENMDLMVEEVRESLKNDLKEILGIKSTVPEMINSKNSSTRIEWQERKDTASIKTGLAEKIERENYVEDTENLTFKRKEIIQLSNKLDKEYNTNQGNELSQNESQNHKIMESVEEAIGNIDDTGRNCCVHIEVTREGQDRGQDVLLKEIREKDIPQSFKNKDKILKASKEDGEILTLTADFSSATLNISKQWSDVFNILRENNFEPKILCQVKLAFKCDGKIRTFSDMQSLSRYISQKSFMKELLKGVLPENEKVTEGGRKYGTQKKVDETLIASKHGAGGTTSDGLSFLFIKEVKVAEPEEITISETYEKEASEIEEEEKQASELEEEETSELEEEEEASELEEGEETSGLEQEASELEEGEETSELEEEEEASELDEGEEASGLEEEEAGLKLEEKEDALVLEGKVKAIQSEIKKNTHGTNSERKKPGTQINNLEQKEEINIQQEQNEDTRIQKNEEGLRNLWDNFKRSNIRIIGVPEGEEKEEEIENIFEKIMKENFPNLAKEIDFQEVQEAQRVPKKLDPRKHTPRHIIITLPKIKDKERILKAAREKEAVTYKGVPIRLSADFSRETLEARRGWQEVFKVMKDKDLHPRLVYPAKLSFRMEGQTKCFPDKVKLKEFIVTKPSLYEMLKGLV